MNHINRHGEINPKPAKGKAPVVPQTQQEQDEKISDPDWSHDPRSEAAHEKHPNKNEVKND